MAGFPNLPVTRGDTDDDASIHLFSRVGPARPVINSDYDMEIIRILDRPVVRKDDTLRQVSPDELNKKFGDFLNSVSESDSDETHVEEDQRADDRNKPVQRTSQGLIPGRQSFNLQIFGFVIGVVIISLFQLVTRKTTETLDSPGLLEINSRLQRIEVSVSALGDVSGALDSQVDSIDARQADFMKNLKSDFENVERLSIDCKNNISIGFDQIQDISKEMSEVKQTVGGIELLTAAPVDLEDRISEITNRLKQYSNASVNLREIRNEIMEDFMSKLPDHVPVYIQNQKIHYIPEFYKFLQSFVEKYGSQSTKDWKSFVEDGGHDFQSYLQTLAKETQVDLITKTDFEYILNKRLSEISDNLTSSYMSMLDRDDSGQNVSRINLAGTGHKVVLDNLLEIIGQGSVKINYADYNLGTRILGFLTTTGKTPNKQKSFVRRVFLGWYDYFNSSGLRGPTRLKFNANNILFDGGDYWQCESNWCSVGMRLASPIILTDLVLSNPAAGRPNDLKLPSTISVYVKPKRKSQAVKLHDYLGRTPNRSLSNNNKYLAKFFKVQEIKVSGDSSLEHIQIPLDLVNLKVIVRDIYLEIGSMEGFTGLHNVKAYGLTELNAVKYGQKFDSILDKMPQFTKVSPAEAWEPDHHDHYTLEDDDYV